MHSISSSQMRELDRKATEIYGIPSLLLMENAGRGVAEYVMSLSSPRTRGSRSMDSRFRGNDKLNKILVVCGKGNNGGDGFVVARHLYNKKVSVEVLLLPSEKELKGDAAVNFQIVKKMGIPIKSLRSLRGGRSPARQASLPSVARNDNSLLACDLIVDAIFGIGLKSEVTGIYREAIEWINQSGKTVLAVDVPSGLDADTGEVHGVAVRASHTATLAAVKHGLVRGEGPLYSGEIGVIDIGLPAIDTP